jgi:hypothetical protein
LLFGLLHQLLRHLLEGLLLLLGQLHPLLGGLLEGLLPLLWLLSPLWTGTGFLTFDPEPICGVTSSGICHRLCSRLRLLAGRSSVCYNHRAKAGGGDLVPVLMFIIFVAVVGVCTLALGYRLASFKERTTSRRCRMPHEMYRGRKVRRQRVRCRFEG